MCMCVCVVPLCFSFACSCRFPGGCVGEAPPLQQVSRPVPCPRRNLPLGAGDLCPALVLDPFTIIVITSSLPPSIPPSLRPSVPPFIPLSIPPSFPSFGNDAEDALCVGSCAPCPCGCNVNTGRTGRVSVSIGANRRGAYPDPRVWAQPAGDSGFLLASARVQTVPRCGPSWPR